MGEESKILYREVQRPNHLLYWLSILLVTGFTWVGFIMQIFFDITVGNQPMSDGMWYVMFAIFGIVFPIVMIFINKLIVEVREDGIYVRFIPFHLQYKVFLFKEIDELKMIQYSSLKRFGGWGLRFNFKGEIGYNFSGGKAIELKVNKQTYVIGTQQPEQLKSVIDSVYKEGSK